jgi:hypothetical protein
MPGVLLLAVFFATLRWLAYVVIWTVVGLVVFSVAVVRWIAAAREGV